MATYHRSEYYNPEDFFEDPPEEKNMTMRTIEGVVMHVSEKARTGPNGPYKMYSVKMNTGEGDHWFSFGFKKPNLSEGQQVKFVVTQNGEYWNADPNTIETVKTAEAAAPAVMAKAVANVDNRQRSIVLQSAYERAILLINGALVNGAVTLPAKKADKFDVYKSLINDTALELAEFFIDPPADFAGAPEKVKDVSAPTAGDGYAVV